MNFSFFVDIGTWIDILILRQWLKRQKVSQIPSILILELCESKVVRLRT